MRGLPSSGKSFRAQQLLDEYNAQSTSSGVIHSTDEFWYKVNKPDLPDEYSFNPRYLGDAHHWNQQRTFRKIELGVPFLIIDNTNTTAKEFCCSYARYAHWQGYKICIEEPTSEWWLEIRDLLKDKKSNKCELKKWAEFLTKESKGPHQVPQWTIERMMWRWENDLNIEQVLNNCVEQHT